MPRRLAVSVGFAGSPEQNKALIERIKVAEEVGVEAIFTAETWGRDQFSLLTQVALQTSKIKLGTGIAPVYGRSPGVLAMTYATLDEISGGRAIIGLGTSGARVIEHWHGEPFAKPIQRTKEYCEIINLIVSGEKVFYEGEVFKLQRGFKLLFKPGARAHPDLHRVHFAAVDGSPWRRRRWLDAASTGPSPSTATARTGPRSRDGSGPGRRPSNASPLSRP